MVRRGQIGAFLAAGTCAALVFGASPSAAASDPLTCAATAGPLPALTPAGLAAPAMDERFRPKVGYWDGKLGKRGPKAEFQMILTPAYRYQLGLQTNIVCGGRRVPVELHLTKVCSIYRRTPCPYTTGFYSSFRFTSRKSIRGTWKLDSRRYPGCHRPRSQRRITAHWRANPHISIKPSRVRAGGTVTVTGTGFLRHEPIYTVGSSPIFQIGAPFYPNRHGAFKRRVPIHPNQAPGFYPDVYLFQRSCLTICWVKGTDSLTVLSP